MPEVSPELLAWISRNRGLMTQIADKAKVTPQFVHQVIHKRRNSKTGKVERLLREAGAPI